MPDYEEYLSLLEERFRRDGFHTTKGISIEPYRLDLVAAKSSWELSKFGKMTRAVLVTKSQVEEPGSVLDFSSRATRYALDNRDSVLPRGFGGSLLSVPVLASEGFDEGLEKWVQQTLAKKHWAAFEFPVLVALGEQRIYYCRKTPVWGSAYYKGFQGFANKYLDPRVPA